MVSWDYPPYSQSAPAAHVAGLSEALAAAGHEVAVLTIAAHGAVVGPQRPGGAPTPAPSVPVLRADPDLPWLPPTRPIARVASANNALARVGVEFHRRLDGWIPDVIHAHDWRSGWAADILAAQHGVPLVVTMHGTERLRRGGHLPQGEPTDINSIEWWLVFRADHVISPTRYLADHLVSEFELDPHRVTRVPNGIDAARWRREPAPDGAPVLPDSTRVFAWGKVQYEKGFQLLGPAMQRLRTTLPNVRCTIAGRGSYLPELQSQIDVEAVSDIVDFVGFLSHEELRAQLHGAGCAVIPSLHEPFGIVALEALAAGAPVVVARTGGLAELLDGTGAGLLFEPGNADELEATLRRVLTDRDLAAELVERGAELVQKRYSWAAIAQRVAEVYNAARADR